MSLDLRSYFEAFSRSAAHSAAPTVLVNEKAIEANGIISRANAAMPSLVQDKLTLCISGVPTQVPQVVQEPTHPV